MLDCFAGVSSYCYTAVKRPYIKLESCYLTFCIIFAKLITYLTIRSQMSIISELFSKNSRAVFTDVLGSASVGLDFGFCAIS